MEGFLESSPSSFSLETSKPTQVPFGRISLLLLYMWAGAFRWVWQITPGSVHTRDNSTSLQSTTPNLVWVAWSTSCAAMCSAHHKHVPQLHSTLFLNLTMLRIDETTAINYSFPHVFSYWSSVSLCLFLTFTFLSVIHHPHCCMRSCIHTDFCTWITIPVINSALDLKWCTLACPDLSS